LGWESFLKSPDQNEHGRLARKPDRPPGPPTTQRRRPGTHWPISLPEPDAPIWRLNEELKRQARAKQYEQTWRAFPSRRQVLIAEGASKRTAIVLLGRVKGFLLCLQLANDAGGEPLAHWCYRIWDSIEQGETTTSQPYWSQWPVPDLRHPDPLARIRGEARRALQARRLAMPNPQLMWPQGRIASDLQQQMLIKPADGWLPTYF